MAEESTPREQKGIPRYTKESTIGRASLYRERRSEEEAEEG